MTNLIYRPAPSSWRKFKDWVLRRERRPLARNEFEKFEELIKVSALIQGAKYIQFDNTDVAPRSCLIPSGVWDMTDCAFSGSQDVDVQVNGHTVFTKGPPESERAFFRVNLGQVLTFRMTDDGRYKKSMMPLNYYADPDPEDPDLS